MNKPRHAHQFSIEEMIQEINEASTFSTGVNLWYPHHDEVRGPFNRWLTVSDVSPEYKKHVGEKVADARYAAACMNFSPSLCDEIIRLRLELLQLKTAPQKGQSDD